MTRLTKQEKIVLAAILGGSNLGMPKPKLERVQNELASLYGERESAQIKMNPRNVCDDVAYTFWSSYMESDEVEKIFITECRWWFRDNLRGMDREEIIGTWPDVAALVWIGESNEAQA